MSLHIPTLAAVVAALTDTPLAELVADLRASARRGAPLIGRDAFELTLRPDWRAPGIVRTRPWVTRSAEEAMELLTLRELAPPEDARRAWVCSMCQGSAKVPAAVGPARVACPACAEECPTCGGTGRVLDTYSADVDEPCEDCDAGSVTDSARGWTAAPLTVPDVVVWAAVGAERILAAEALTREAAAHFGVDLARVLWRVGPRAATTVVARYPCGASVTADGSVWSWPESPPRAPHVESVKGIWAMGMGLGPLGADTVLAIDAARSGEDTTYAVAARPLTDEAREETAR